MKTSVYLDTTIFSYYVDERPELSVHIERTKEWWDKEKDFYDLCISNFVLLELKDKKYPNQEEALSLVFDDIKVLDPVKQIDNIVNFYLKNQLMPKNDIRDALHLAYTSFYEIDILLTWNCSHLANINKKGHIININKRLGLHVPEIITPLELRIT